MWGFLSGAALNTGLDVPVGRMVSPDMHLGVGPSDHRVALSASFTQDPSFGSLC